MRRVVQSVQMHIALILFCGIAIYINTLQVPFYLDDYPCIVNNPIVHDPGNLLRLGDYPQLGISEDIRNSVVTRWVTYLTFALNYRLHGLSVAGYHAVNLLIHLLNALLVYEFVRLALRLVQRAEDSPVHCSTLALTVALLFVAHPIQTNAITYIVQRFTSLATLFCLVTLVAYVRSCLTASPALRRIFYLGALLSALLAMFSGEIAFTLPLVLAIFDFTLLHGGGRRFWRLIPFFATMLPLPLTVMALAATSEVTNYSIVNALELANTGHGSPWDYFFTQWRVVVTYIRLMLVPAGLHLDYDYPYYTSPWEMPVLASGLFLAALFAAGLSLLLRRHNDPGKGDVGRLTGFGIVWFFIALSMTSSIIPLDDLIFEYRLYLPSIGFILAAVSAVDTASRRIFSSWAPRRAIAAGAAVMITVLAIATVVRNRTWQNDLVFWQDTVSKSPEKGRTHLALAMIYFKHHRLEEAATHAKMASEGRGHNDLTRVQLARLFNKLGMDEAAITEMIEAINSRPNFAHYHAVLGQLYLNTGRTSEAKEAFETALRLDPADAENVKATLDNFSLPQT